MKTYLITGAAGFIGSNFLKYMLGRHPQERFIALDALTYAASYQTIEKDVDDKRCVFVKGSILDGMLLDSLFEEYDIDVVVHFAAESHVDRSIDGPRLFLETNIMGTQTLLDAARKSWQTGVDASGYPVYRAGCRYHQVSTDEVYGALGPEGFFSELTPLNPHSPYSASKASADLVVQCYRDTFHLPVSISRCSNNYGPYQFPEKLIPLVINNILQGRSIPVYGDGLQVRDWLYVMDHCSAIERIILQGADGCVYNVGGNNEVANIEIVRTILSTIREILTEREDLRSCVTAPQFLKDGDLDWIGEGLISYVRDRLGHDRRYAIDASKLSRELSWNPSTRFREGIRSTILWNLENRSWVDTVTSGAYRDYYERMYRGR